MTEVNTWDLGDYPQLARTLEPAAAAVVDAAGPGEGRPALDVAAGDGSVAALLAAAGWRVLATDGSRRMVQLGQERTRGADIAWEHADVARQPVDGATQDLVASSFGLIFAQDPDTGVAEVARVLRPGGRLVFTAWTEGGHMSQMTDLMLDFFPGPHDPGPLRWGSEPFLEAVLAQEFDAVDVQPRVLPWSFPSAHEGRVMMQTASPAHVAARQALGDRADEMMDAVEQHLASKAGPDGTVTVEAEYLLVSARRR